MTKAPPDTAGTRGTLGVVATIVPTADGMLRLIFDDVTRGDSSESDSWCKQCLFTFKDFDQQEFLRSELSEQTLADLGLALVARLSALNGSA